ncbi:MAG: DUF3341 domain-containing protein [Ignavibacteria bacterium]|nr:DUF3341 domain-containing protein [Ignavibacteria bacterium]
MKTLAILADFGTPGALLHAAEKVRTAGYRAFDCHSPFAIHGMDAAMGLGRSPIGYIVGGMALLGASIGYGLQTWVTTTAYPIIISGKPLYSWQAYIIVTFALFVLFGALGGVIGMLRLNRLPRLHHPLFYSERFGRVTDNAFMVSIEAGDPLFDETGTRDFLSSIGGTNIELVKGD